MLCSKTVGEGVGGSASACLATAKYDHKQLHLCQVCNSACNYTHLCLGYIHYCLCVFKDLSGGVRHGGVVLRDTV